MNSTSLEPDAAEGLRRSGRDGPIGHAMSPLGRAICSRDWDLAAELAIERKEEAGRWISEVIPYFSGRSRRRVFLPIHAACALKPPDWFVSILLRSHPNGASAVDSEGMTPLHHACANRASGSSIQVLIAAYPYSPCKRDNTKRLPIHYVAMVGPSDSAIVDVLLTYNNKIADAEDIEGRTPHQYAKYSTYAERDKVIDSLVMFSRDARNCNGLQLANKVMQTQANRQRHAHKNDQNTATTANSNSNSNNTSTPATSAATATATSNNSNRRSTSDTESRLPNIFLKKVDGATSKLDESLLKLTRTLGSADDVPTTYTRAPYPLIDPLHHDRLQDLRRSQLVANSIRQAGETSHYYALSRYLPKPDADGTTDITTLTETTPTQMQDAVKTHHPNTLEPSPEEHQDPIEEVRDEDIIPKDRAHDDYGLTKRDPDEMGVQIHSKQGNVEIALL